MTHLDLFAWNLLDSLPLAAGEPDVNSVMLLRIVARAIHITCAVILGGGIFYMRTILAPSGPDACFADRRHPWSRWVMVTSALLLITGLFTFIVYNRLSKAPGATPLSGTYHMIFGVHMLLALVVMFIAALVAGKSAGAERARGNINRWLRIAWTSVMAIIILGAMMRMMHEPAPTLIAQPLANPAN